MRIDINCARCGGDHFSLEKDVDDSSVVRCQNCGHEIGTMGDLKKMLAVEVLKRSIPPKHRT